MFRDVPGFSGMFRHVPECSSLLRRGLFVLWGGWGERKRERAGQDGKGEERREAPAVALFPSSPARFPIFSIIDILMGIPSGSLCGGERECSVFPVLSTPERNTLDI